VASGLASFEAAAEDKRALAAIDFQAMINLTKVDASELAVATVMTALRACGLSGYRNDGEFSLTRHLRDVLSSPLMINNDRIIANISTSLLFGGTPQSLGTPRPLQTTSASADPQTWSDRA
jgi:acyl-CoA dehydrogenase